MVLQACTFMTDGSTAVHVYDRWFYSRARLWPMVLHACTFMTDGSTGGHVYDRWLYRRAHLWPMVLQVCTFIVLQVCTFMVLQACTFMTDGSTLVFVHNRGFYRCAPCTTDSSRVVQCVVHGSTVVHFVWPMVLQLSTVHDRWFYSSSLCMTDGSIIVYGAWPIVIQLCMLYELLSPFLNSFRLIALTGVSFDSISVNTGDSDPCSSRNMQQSFNYLANFCSCERTRFAYKSRKYY